MVKAQDQGDYFRVPLDARSLQYELYFEEGERAAVASWRTTPPSQHRAAGRRGRPRTCC